MGKGWQSWNGVPTLYVPRWVGEEATLAVLPKALRAASEVDVVHVTSVFCVSSLQGLVAGLKAHRPVVLSVRGALQPVAMQASRAKKRLWLSALGGLYRRVSLFHATATHEANAIEATFGATSPIVIVPNGAEVPSETKLAEWRAATPPGELPVVGMLGRVHPIKAIERVIEALALLRDAGVGARLTVAGPPQDQAYLGRLRVLAEQRAVADRVSFLPPLLGEQKDRFLVGCRVVAVASHSENFSNVVVEALALGVPVVASLGTPWSELPKAGCGDWVSNTPADLAQAMRPYLESRGIADAAGEKGRQLVIDRYTWPSAARAMRDAYAGVLDRHTSTRASHA